MKKLRKKIGKNHSIAPLSNFSLQGHLKKCLLFMKNIKLLEENYDFNIFFTSILTMVFLTNLPGEKMNFSGFLQKIQ